MYIQTQYYSIQIKLFISAISLCDVLVVLKRTDVSGGPGGTDECLPEPSVLLTVSDVTVDCCAVQRRVPEVDVNAAHW